MPQVGTLDIDLGLDAESFGDGEYALLIDALRSHGYQQRKELRHFQLVRQVPAATGGEPIDIIVDFLMPRGAEIVKNVPPLSSDFAVQRADGADLAMRFYQLVAITGQMPAGGTNRVEIAVCSIPALLAMKGHAMEGDYAKAGAEDGINPGCQRSNVARRSWFNVAVRNCSSKWAFSGCQRICCFFTNR